MILHRSTSNNVLIFSIIILLVDFTPSKTPYNPRHMLGGTTQPDGTYVSGFFDKGTFKEYLGKCILFSIPHPLFAFLFYFMNLI